MTRKAALSFVLLILISLTSKLSNAKQEPSDEDIEETSELIANYLGPLLELNDFTLDDLPDHLKYLTAKYYLIFSRGVEPLDTLEKMVSDYEIIQNSQHIVSENFQEHIEHFVKINTSTNKKALKKLVSKMLDTFNFRLQVVSPRDAVKFLLYQEAYPDTMKIISHMVHKHYDAYLKERAKEKRSSSQSLNSTDDVGFDAAAVVRDFVVSHGRLELVKRILSSLEQYIPPVDRADIRESTLDYLDDLNEFLDAKSKSVWHFIKDFRFRTTTDEWITRTDELLTDFLKVIPFQEILNLFDAIVLNSNDRRAFIILRYELRKSNGPHALLTNGQDVFNFVSTSIINDLMDIRKSLEDTVFETSNEEDFLKYLDKLFAPYDIDTNDFSNEMRSIISRTFTRIKSMRGQSPADFRNKILKADLVSIREHLEKARDAIGILIPEQSESNHIELRNLLQSIVNKFGAFVIEMEQGSVQFFNSLINNPSDSEKIVEEKTDSFAQKFGAVFKSSGKKPSELIKDRFFEVVEIIDAFVNVTSF